MGKFKVIIVVVILALCAGGYYYFFGIKSSGARAGTILKLSKKGIVFKTWEGELNAFMYVGDESAAAGYTTTLFQFSIKKEHEDLVKKIEQAMLDGKRVQLKYDQKFMSFPWEGDTDYFIVDVVVKE